MALTYFEISFSDVYWSKKAFVSINLSVFVEIILSELAESDIPLPKYPAHEKVNSFRLTASKGQLRHQASGAIGTRGMMQSPTSEVGLPIVAFFVAAV